LFGVKKPNKFGHYKITQASRKDYQNASGNLEEARSLTLLEAFDFSQPQNRWLRKNIPFFHLCQ